MAADRPPRPDAADHGDAVTVTELDGRTVVAILGDLDAVSAPEARDRLLEVIAGAPGVVDVDLAAVGFLDSAGVSGLVVAHNRALDAGVELRLVSVPAGSRRVLEITRLADVFTIVD